MVKKVIALTGGAGYIGSHLALSLLDHGYEPLIIDNFVNSDKKIIKKLESISNKKILNYPIDINECDELTNIFKNTKIEAVIHLAALKSIPESLDKPLVYFNNNVNGLINTLIAMKRGACNKIIFSSSCSVYSRKAIVPVTENSSIEGNNPYSKSKIICEEILDQTSKADPLLEHVSLRYFNPIGAHSSGIFGDNLESKNTNLMSEVCKVANNQKSYLKVFGSDYETVDGTCIRDYIHINDLVEGHISAMNNLSNLHAIPSINLGTGKGCTVLELVKTFEKVNNIKIPYKLEKRRNGDLEKIYADATLAKKLLKWKTEHNLDTMCSSSWNYAKI